MKVVFIRSNPVSPDSRVEKEVDALNKDGHDVLVLGWERSKNSKLIKEKITVPSGKIDIYRIGVKAGFGNGFKKSLLPLLKFQIKFIIWLFLNSKKYDVIHACDFEVAFPSLICAKILRKKIVYDIFDFYTASHKLPARVSKVVQRIDNIVINRVDCVIICSEKRKEQIRESQPKMIEVIHNSPSKDQISINEKSIKKKSVKTLVSIAYVGILSKSRLLNELVDCVSERDDCELHIGGFGQLEDYIQKKSESSSNIYFYGKIPYHETLQLERDCDILTAIYDPNVSNHQYAAPNKFYEALFLGKPLIMAKNTGMDKIVNRKNIGVVISYNQESLNKGITNLINKREEWLGMSKRMKEIYESEFSWSIMEKRLQEIYSKIDNK